MPNPRNDLRAELAALCQRRLDWNADMSRTLLDASLARRAAVLVLFGVLDSVPARSPTATSSPVARDLDVLLLRRAATLGHHPGEVAFPGGRLDESDADPAAGALREAVEETGLDPHGLETLGLLSTLPVPISNYLVTPVLAWWTRPSEVAAVDHEETVDVFRMPVANLLDPANRANTEHVIGDRTFRTPAFTVDGKLVWGFTAIVLSRIFDELDWAPPWDSDRIVLPQP